MLELEFLTHRKDGGPESHVWGYWLIAIRRLFSIILLRFEDGSREAHHSHAFNCVSWVVRGRLLEQHFDGRVEVHSASIWPFVTRRDTYHKVSSVGRSLVLTFRGPWAPTWREYLETTKKHRVLTWGRNVVSESSESLSP